MKIRACIKSLLVFTCWLAVVPATPAAESRALKRSNVE
jgi:hypothetical protein